MILKNYTLKIRGATRQSPVDSVGFLGDAGNYAIGGFLAILIGNL